MELNTLARPSTNPFQGIQEAVMRSKSILRQTPIKDRIARAREDNRSVAHLVYGLPDDLLEEALKLMRLPERVRYERLVTRRREKDREAELAKAALTADVLARKAKEETSSQNVIPTSEPEAKGGAVVIDLMTRKRLS